jgi:peptidoglycan hydrolase-like amidase
MTVAGTISAAAADEKIAETTDATIVVTREITAEEMIGARIEVVITTDETTRKTTTRLTTTVRATLREGHVTRPDHVTRTTGAKTAPLPGKGRGPRSAETSEIKVRIALIRTTNVVLIPKWILTIKTQFQSPRPSQNL